jgi:hypothetical protein
MMIETEFMNRSEKLFVAGIDMFLSVSRRVINVFLSADPHIIVSTALGRPFKDIAEVESPGGVQGRVQEKSMMVVSIEMEGAASILATPSHIWIISRDKIQDFTSGRVITCYRRRSQS